MVAVPLEPHLFRVDGAQPVLLGSRCAPCDETFFPQRRLCAVCATPTDPVNLSTSGTLYSHTYVHVPYFGKRRVDGGGYGVGQIDLPERVRVQCVITGEPTSWSIGMAMRIEAEEVDRTPEGDDVVIFRFAPGEVGVDA